jgi:hypothetical protein
MPRTIYSAIKEKYVNHSGGCSEVISYHILHPIEWLWLWDVAVAMSSTVVPEIWA